MSRRHLVMLLVLAALWGASFMFIKIGDRELKPITLVGFRMALGTLTLVPIVLVTVGARRTLQELRAAAVPLIVIGLLNSAIPIYSISWAETRIDSGLTAIIQASAPLFTALLASSVMFESSCRRSSVPCATSMRDWVYAAFAAALPSGIWTCPPAA
jgi:drug/metabolite transporter (DMT)-like permease